MNDPELDLFETPLAFAVLDGTIAKANRAFRSWTAGDAPELGAALGVALADVLPTLRAGKRHAVKGEAKNERGRAFPVEYHLRLASRDGSEVIVVEGRDLSRVAEKEVMIRSFTKTVEANNRLLRHQKDEIAGLLKDTQVAHAAVQRLLDSVDQGFVTLDRAGRVMGERSAVFDRWFGAPEVGTVFAECLRQLNPDTAESFLMGWSQLEDDCLPLEMLIEQLPAATRSDDRHFRLFYKPNLDDSGRLVNLLVVMTDVTAEVERMRSEAHQTELLNLMARFSSDREGFHEFVRDADRLVGAITTFPLGSTELKRAVHTLKGNCALFGAQVVATHCHEFEDRLAELGELTSELDRNTLGRVWTSLRERLGMFLDEDQDVITIAREEFDALRRKVRGSGELTRIMDTWTWEPGARRLSRVGDQVRALARRLGKDNVDVELHADELRLQPEHWGAFWSSFVHVIRNGIDHGVESPEERAALNKPERARIALRMRLTDDRLSVEFSDDGRGIDWAGVARKAAERGLDAGSRAALVRALFSDGFSTRDEVTEQSGRGVGLPAVLVACNALGGTVEVESAPGRGALFRFTFPAAGFAVAYSATPERAALSAE